MPSNPVFCSQCGHANLTEAAFCAECGSKLFKGDGNDTPVGTTGGVVNISGQDFVPLTCPSCGGKLEVGPDIHRLTCLNCGTTHDVLRDNPIPVLRPIIAQINRVGEQLEVETQVRAGTAQVSAQTYGAVSAQAAVIQQAHTQEKITQQILMIQQSIDEKKHEIEELGNPKTDNKIGWSMFLVFFVLGVIGEIAFGQTRDLQGHGGFVFTVFMIPGALFLLGSWINGMGPKAQQARKLVKEIKELQSQQDQLQMGGMSGQIPPIPSQFGAVQPANPSADPTRSSPIKPPKAPPGYK
jgi:predicted RNA-binding Zn-ribbon protein involved in translation (DUF1610 family)